MFIHAAKYFPKATQELCRTSPYKEALGALGIFDPKQLPLDQIIGAMDLENCIATWGANKYGEAMIAPGTPQGVGNVGPEYLSRTETQLGNYDIARYAWIASNHRLLVRPIVYTNGQGYYRRFKGETDGIRFLQKAGEYDVAKEWFGTV